MIDIRTRVRELPLGLGRNELLCARTSGRGFGIQTVGRRVNHTPLESQY